MDAHLAERKRLFCNLLEREYVSKLTRCSITIAIMIHQSMGSITILLSCLHWNGTRIPDYNCWAASNRDGSSGTLKKP
jgi:hypothetical protein